MKILLAVDGSTDSQLAVAELAARPWPPNSTVRVLTAVSRRYQPPMIELVSTGETPAAVRAGHVQEGEDLTRSVAESLKPTGLTAETAVREGDPRRVIVDEAKEWPADLIILGARGHNALERWLIGSVAQAVVAHAHCSVEVVRRS